MYPLEIFHWRGGVEHPVVLLLCHDWLRRAIRDPKVTLEHQRIVDLGERRTILKLLQIDIFTKINSVNLLACNIDLRKDGTFWNVSLNILWNTNWQMYKVSHARAPP